VIDAPQVVVPPVAPVGSSTTAVLPIGQPAFPFQAMIGSAMPERQSKRPTSGPASRLEWRTPPLWGFRDSAPYLHDGRARTLDQAVSFHGGEAAPIAQSYSTLSAKERRQLETFLKSLTAPRNSALVASVN
jgi:CxxC motif-containing protein (DUF1111 family)